jgi:hypothetical protein
MALENWTLVGPAVKTENLGPLQYKIAKGFNATFSTFNPGNSGVPITYYIGWDSAPGFSSSSSGGGHWTIDTNNVQNFLSDCLGYSYVIPTGDPDEPYFLRRILPDSLFDWPVFYAQSAKVEGIGAPGESPYTFEIDYPVAKVTVDYKPFDFRLLEDNELSGNLGQELERYVTRGMGFEQQMLTLNGNMKYCTVPKDNVATPPGKITGTQEFNFTWHQVPALQGNPFTPPNLQAIIDCLGRVNSVPFDTVAGLNSPAGTVLFMSADVKMELPSLGGSEAQSFLTFGGLYYWTITMKFLVRNNGVYSAMRGQPGNPGGFGNTDLNGVVQGHNFIYRITGPSSLRKPFWDLITADGNFTVTAGTPPTVDGITIYESADLNTLFTITG